MARAEDGLASVISTGLNLGPLLPDPAHTDTITSYHQRVTLLYGGGEKLRKFSGSINMKRIL